MEDKIRVFWGLLDYGIYLAGPNVYVMNRSQVIAITQYKPLLEVIAYNIVKCKQDAEDIVQDTFLKLLSKGDQQIENIKAYLVKAVTNNCLQHLKTLRLKKEELYDSIQIKEAFNRFKDTNFSYLDIDINLNAALKVVQSKLEPLERAVYVLREFFDFDYDALQETLDKKKDHCRQLFSRAKRKIQEEKSISQSTEKPGFFQNFKNACDFGHISGLIDELKKDIADTFSSKK